MTCVTTAARWIVVGALIGSPLTAFAEAPDLTLMDLDGKQHRLDEYIGNGKWVVLNIWGPKCPPCVEEMPELQVFHNAHQDKDAIVVGLAVDYPTFGYAKVDQVREFIDDFFITYPILLGSQDSVPPLGGGPLLGTPTTLVYEPNGKLVGQQLGQITAEIIENFISSYQPAK